LHIEPPGKVRDDDQLPRLAPQQIVFSSKLSPPKKGHNLLRCQGDFNKRRRLTNSQQLPHFSQNSEPAMSEVLTINVRGLHTDTALAVYGGSLLTSTNQGSPLRNSSRDDWSLSPHRWLCAETTLTVLA